MATSWSGALTCSSPDPLTVKIVAWIAALLETGGGESPPVNPDLPPVIVVHGIQATRADLLRLRNELSRDGREVHAPTLTPADGSATIEELSKKLAEFIDANLQRRPFDLIGYSMGGIVTRHYLQRRGGLSQVRRYISLCAPNHGTIMGWLNNGPGAKQMRIGSDFLKQLNAEAEPLRQIPFTCFWTWTDLIILPATSSKMPQAKNVRVTGIGHPTFMLEKRNIRRIVSALR